MDANWQVVNSKRSTRRGKRIFMGKRILMGSVGMSEAPSTVIA